MEPTDDADRLLALVLAVKAARREINRRFNHALRPLGVTAVQAEALLLVGELEPVSVRELGARILAESGNPSRLTDRLVEAGLLLREANGTDRRRVDLRLTPAGRHLCARIQEARAPLLSAAAARLSAHDVAAATHTLRVLAGDG